ncbi:MAG: branched-chain amino acid ABC transporter substrate-binding protein [Anaerolineales bacterium]|nr:branched-chain amino acid ABC transporter substrate-binding protein [Anaerolineales bacterium]
MSKYSFSAGFVTLLALAGLLLAACGGAPIPAPATLKIVSSLPMTGAVYDRVQKAKNAIERRLAQAGGKACGGKYALVDEAWDDASAAKGTWDGAIETENANKAARDPQIVVYIGPGNSGAAKFSIPILNRAGLAMISPMNTYPGLTKPGKGEPDEPDKYYPTGIRNYTRVMAADDIQGAVAASFVSQQGVRSVYLLDDGELYGKGVADVFEKTALKIGLTVLGRKTIDIKAADYKALMNEIAASNAGGPPDAIYAGVIYVNNAAQVLKDKVAVMGNQSRVKYIVPENLHAQSFIDAVGAADAEGVYVSLPGVSPSALPAAGRQFIEDYEAEFGKLGSEVFALYGYEALNVALKAIEEVCAAGGKPTDRKAVRDALFAIKDFEGVLGTWSFDANGDTSLTQTTFYVVKNGAFEAVKTFK